MTRLGLNGYGVRPAGDFSGREIPHPVGIITRLSLNGYGIRRIGDFSGKPESEIIEAIPETYSGGYFDFEALRLPRRHFEAETEEEREAKPVLEDINEQLQTPGVETKTDLEIVLRMRLRLQNIRYQELYLEWLEQALEQKKALIKRKRRNKAVTLLLLH